MSFYTDEYLKKVYNKSDVTAEIHGGNERARYYSNISFTHNNSLMKLGEQKKDKSIDFRVRTNVDMNLTKWLKASTSAAVKIQTVTMVVVIFGGRQLHFALTGSHLICPWI